MLALRELESFRFYFIMLPHFYLVLTSKPKFESLGYSSSFKLSIIERIIFYFIYNSCNNFIFCLPVKSFSATIDFTTFSLFFYSNANFSLSLTFAAQINSIRTLVSCNFFRSSSSAIPFLYKFEDNSVILRSLTQISSFNFLNYYFRSRICYFCLFTISFSERCYSLIAYNYFFSSLYLFWACLRFC